MSLYDSTLPYRVECRCMVCRKFFTLRRAVVLTGRGLYCSRPCRSAAESKTLVDRFWAHVQKTDGCWLWTAAKNPKGYGVFCVDKKANDIELAHRVSYRLHNGEIPSHLRVLHSCDTPWCVRPDHLFLGTPDDNMQDKVAKGRQTQGEQVKVSKLSEGQVIEIRQRYATSTISQAALAREYGVCHATMWSLLTEKTWRHLL